MNWSELIWEAVAAFIAVVVAIALLVFYGLYDLARGLIWIVLGRSESRARAGPARE